jgi:hypothetical protein
MTLSAPAGRGVERDGHQDGGRREARDDADGMEAPSAMRSARE